MPKIFIQKVQLEPCFFLEVKFFYSYPFQDKKIRSSFSLVFKVVAISSEGFAEITNLQLGEWLVKKILDSSILPFQQNTTVYNRLQIRVADDSQKVITQFKYDILYKSGRLASPVEDVSLVQGLYTCRFSNINSRSQLILRIRNFIGPPSHSYWIDDILTQPIAFLIDKITIQIQFKYNSAV